MQVKREPFRLHWEGAVTTDRLPGDIVYGPRLGLRHDEAERAAERLVDALASFAGPGKVRRLPLLGTRVTWDGKYPMRARVRPDSLELHVDRRLKGKALPRLVAALASLRGARDLTLEGERPEVCGDYDDIGPCTPCAAGRYPRKG